PLQRLLSLVLEADPTVLSRLRGRLGLLHRGGLLLLLDGPALLDRRSGLHRRLGGPLRHRGGLDGRLLRWGGPDALLGFLSLDGSRLGLDAAGLDLRLQRLQLLVEALTRSLDLRLGPGHAPTALEAVGLAE